MNFRKLAISSLALAGTLAAGLAHAHGEVQWSLSLPGPLGPVGVTVSSRGDLPLPPLPRIVVPAPVQVLPIYAPVHHERDREVYRDGYVYRDRPGHPYPTRWDSDGDGIPNRYDRVYNPRWDRDGDGVPNRYDRVYNPRWDRDGDGIPNRRDHRDGHGWGR